MMIDLCYTITPHKSAQGIYAVCFMWNLCGVVVFHGYMVDWRRGWGQSVMQLMQCSGLPWIYGQLEEGTGFSLLWKLFGVMVFQRSMLDWLGGSIGQSRFPCQIWTHLHFMLCFTQGGFCITYERPHNNNNNIKINLHILFNIFVIIICLIIVFTV